MASSNSSDHPSRQGAAQQPKAGSEREAVLRELRALGTDAQLLEQWKAASPAADHPESAAPGVSSAQRQALRSAILAKTVGRNSTAPAASTSAPAASAPAPATGSTSPGSSKVRHMAPIRRWMPLAAAAVLGVALVGAWFALQPEAEADCVSLACLLDALPAESLLELNEGAVAQDYMPFNTAWAFAADAVDEEPYPTGDAPLSGDGSSQEGSSTEGGSDAVLHEGSGRAFAEGALDAEAAVLQHFEQDPLELEQLDWDALQLDDVSLDALEDALFGTNSDGIP